MNYDVAKLMNTIDVHIEKIKISGYSLTYVCSDKFKDIRQSIYLKCFHEKIDYFETKHIYSNYGCINSRIEKLSTKLMKLDEDQQSNIIDKYTNSLYKSLGCDFISDIFDKRLSFNIWESKESNKLLNKLDKTLQSLLERNKNRDLNLDQIKLFHKLFNKYNNKRDQFWYILKNLKIKLLQNQTS